MTDVVILNSIIQHNYIFSVIAEAKSYGADRKNRPVDRAEHLDDYRRYILAKYEILSATLSGMQKLRRLFSHIIEANSDSIC